MTECSRRLTQGDHVQEPGVRPTIPDITERLAAASDDEVVADLIRMARAERAVAFRLLPKDRAARIFDALGSSIASELVVDLSDRHVREIFEELAPDDQTMIIDEMPAGVANRVLRDLPEDRRADTMKLLGYSKESAGRRMSPVYSSLGPDLTAAQALTELQGQASRGVPIADAPVVDSTRGLLGVVRLATLIAADPKQRVGELPLGGARVTTDVDQELAAQTLLRSGVDVLPVVDAENRLVGVITEDDALHIDDLESDEDAALAGGSTPLRRPYLASSVFSLASKRVIWLLVLLVAASLTVGVLDAFESALESMVVLSLFIPLLIGTGGNTGAQSVTTVVRALSTGEVRFRDFFRVAFTEFRTGALLGVVLGAAVFVPVTLFAGWQVAAVLSLSLVGICMLATTAGAVIPLLASRVGVDPAVVSSPFISTIVDAVGLILYFLIAKAILGI
nr:magnesium transporter [Brevibacterium daeguense]